MSVLRATVSALLIGAAAPVAPADGLDAMAGKALFERTWIAAPSSTDASDGLGPLFNGRSCASCHAGGGGARLKSGADSVTRLVGAVVRLGTPDGAGDPFYGAQLQTGAVAGLTPEAVVQFFPKLKITLNGPPLANGIAASVRLAPPLTGVAAFDVIRESEILSRADPDDADGDGISGRARIVNGRVGRFGWKAAHATLEDQIAHAFALDIGLSSASQPLPFGDCTPVQRDCRQAPTGESALSQGHEISSAALALVGRYLQSLAAPASPTNAEGAALFSATGCARCHVPELAAADGSRIAAFSDLLLHDMGPERDDGVGEAGVQPREWRTAPLRNWYLKTSARRYLHDGSAATVAEAIAKHGGEAAGSRRIVQSLSGKDQARLIDYVSGLP